MRVMSMRSTRPSLIVWCLLGALAGFGLVGCSDEDGENSDPFQLAKDLRLRVDPTTVTFVGVPNGGHGEETVTVTHIGQSGSIQLRDVRLDTASPDLAAGQPDKTTLEPGQSATILVSFDPSDESQDRGTLLIGTNVPDAAGGTTTYEVDIRTPAPIASFVAAPGLLDFGQVPRGGSKTASVRLLHDGSLEAKVTGIHIKDASRDYFAVETAPALPATYQPEQELAIDLSYSPAETGADDATLVVTFEDRGEARTVEVRLRGAGVEPRLVVSPNPLDFGSREPSGTYVESLFIANQGNLDLTITAVEVVGTGDWASTITVAPLAAEGVSLAPGGATHQIDVTFAPPANMPVVTTPLASIRFVSNDVAGAGETLVPVFGRPEAPALRVNPPDLVTFGFVAQNLTTTKTVSLYNAGSADLTIQSVAVADGLDALAGEYTVVDGEAWGPTKAVPEPVTLSAGQSQVVKVAFKNTGGDTGDAWGLLTIVSTDPDRANWEVDLKAARAGQPKCEVQLTPNVLEYGIVPRGFTKTMSMNLTVIGAGTCSFDSALINDCGGFPIPGFPATCDDPSATIQTNGNSKVYQLVKTPLALQNGLKPGESYPIEILFTPPDTAPIFGTDETTQYAGLLAVRINDPYAPPGSPPKLVTTSSGAGTYAANLFAKSGRAELSVFPNELDFGLTTIGCHSQTLAINAYNVGTAPLDISHFELVECSLEYQIKTQPALNEPDGAGGFKKTLNPGDGVLFEIVYVPQDTGGDSCSLNIFTNGADTAAAVVPLNGEGTYETEHTDTFIQKSGQDVDVLFVVDDSGSMGEEQNNLANNFSSFIGQAAAWQNDYHIAVVTTDVDGGSGVFRGDPRFIDPTTTSKFASNVKVGTNGSGTERGLEAAQLALSLPNIADSSTTCTADAECAAVGGACHDGFCGGPNRGFLRKDANLEVVFVSDEEDQSPSDLNFYVNFFKNIKGFYNENLFHAHAIVGPSGGCSSSNGDASAGHRYMDVAAQTGGNSASICEPDFATALASIGEIAFGLKVQFFLSRVPEPSSIQVSVAGQACAAGGSWSYDLQSNSVVFQETGGCMPQPGEEVRIHYDTICFLE